MDFKRVQITTTAVEEEQISVNCELKDAKQIVAALRAAHPYEEPLIDIVLLINEEDL